MFKPRHCSLLYGLHQDIITRKVQKTVLRYLVHHSVIFTFSYSLHILVKHLVKQNISTGSW